MKKAGEEKFFTCFLVPLNCFQGIFNLAVA